MELFRRVFDTNLLMQIASVLAVALFFKALSANFVVNWAAVMAMG